MVVVGSLSSMLIYMWRPSMCFLLQFDMSSLSGRTISWHVWSLLRFQRKPNPLLLSLHLANHSNEVKVTNSRKMNQIEKVL